MPVDPHEHLRPGLTARPWSRAADGGPDPDERRRMLDLVLTVERAAIGESDTATDEIEEMFTGPTTDREASVIVEEDGDLVGFAWIEFDPSSCESWIDAYALPGRADVVDCLLRYATAVAAEHRSSAPEASEWSLRSGAFATDEEQAAALERAGFERVRRFWRMRIDLTEGVPDPSPLPDGVELVDAHAEPLRRTAYEVQTTAFHDHWNHSTRPYDEWFAFFDQSHFDPAGWWVLTVDGTPAAVCLLDDSRRDIAEGYVRSLGVLREFRGRGLARLLLERAFAYYRDRGFVGVQLGVDSDSPTGANHLYEKVGMRPHRVIDAWSLPVR
jgi:ribosomal protein S18 acetylase RimI-like enzyme